jgi:16S rRNA processing protein RimM
MSLLEVGRIAKAHGLKGEVIVRLLSDRAERLAPGSVLQSARGPLTVVRSARHQDKWRVAFEGIADRDGAEALHGTVLLAEPIDDPDALWIHELIGAEVVDASGAHIGTVEAVEANPAHDILVLDGERLVPLTFVIDHQPGRLTVELPAGIFDLQD